MLLRPITTYNQSHEDTPLWDGFPHYLMREIVPRRGGLRTRHMCVNDPEGLHFIAAPDASANGDLSLGQGLSDVQSWSARPRL